MIPMHLSSYAEITGAEAISQLQQLAGDLAGASVVHVNATRSGGGVAEILSWLVPLMNDLGIHASWEVIQGSEDFFRVTKFFHNSLQGAPGRFPESRLRLYENVVAENAERLRTKLEDADFVFIHDPQPAYLLNLCPNRKGKWIWRCHIDVSHPNHFTWSYLRRIVTGYDASIFSMPIFAQHLDHRQYIIAPSIDPLSEKNRELPASEVAEIVTGLGIDPTIPILSQISRFDRFKDPVGVVSAFKMLGPRLQAQLVLAGGGASDDPEGEAVYQEVLDAKADDDRIHVLLLPNDAHRTINALQRVSTIAIQKSLQEGFGLTVTEALWKGKPVIGGNVGGIRLQVHNHHTGFLVDTPEGAALRIRELLQHPRNCERMGRVAHEFVRENFLLTRNLREYLTLLLGLKRGTSRDTVIA